MITELYQNVGFKGTAQEEIRASKGIINDGVLLKIHDDNEVAPRPTRVGMKNQSRPGTT